MRPEKTLLQEVSSDAPAIKDSRANPIQQETPDRSMNFIRNFILGIPTQELQETQQVEQPVPLPEDQGDLDLIKRLSGIK